MRPTLADRLLAHTDRFLRVALSQYVTNGLTVTLGLVVIMLLVLKKKKLEGASSAALGVMVTSMPDVPAPRKRKFMQMLPAPLLGIPLFMLVHLVRDDVLLLGVMIVAGTFLAVMVMAWGKRGGPITFALGAGLYLLWGVPNTPTPPRC